MQFLKLCFFSGLRYLTAGYRLEFKGIRLIVLNPLQDWGVQVNLFKEAKNGGAHLLHTSLELKQTNKLDYGFSIVSINPDEWTLKSVDFGTSLE